MATDLFNIPYRVSAWFFAGGALLSTFAGILPYDVQFGGFVAGLIFIGIGAISAALHFMRGLSISTSANQKPADMTAQEAVEWIACESKWAWWQYPSCSIGKIWAEAAMEFEGAARKGLISVRRYRDNSADYQVLPMGYWDTARLDISDILNSLGSSGQAVTKSLVTYPPSNGFGPDRVVCGLLVDRQEVVDTWPKAGKLFRWYINNIY